MGFFAIVSVYISILGLFLFVMLFGESSAFEGSIVQKAHWFISAGLCEYVKKGLGCVFGKWGEQAFDYVTDSCCNRPNPLLQFFYLALIGAAYYFFGNAIFPYIPGTYVSDAHRFVGPALVLLCLSSFYLTSFCDPGVITKANVQKHLKSYPYDNVIYKEKVCTTCATKRPARSKHCSICDRCIARFDHHCGWMNNCIGEKNVRFFLAFLLGHTLLCWYGVGVMVAILAGEVHDRGLMEALATDSSGEYGPEKGPWPRLSFILQWLLVHYGVHVMLAVFAFIISLLLAGFSIYHLYLVYRNTTTNETFKWADYKRWRAHEARRAGASAPRVSHGEAKSHEKQSSASASWLGGSRRRKGPVKEQQPSSAVVNSYDRGLRRNLWEVLRPPSERQR